MADDLARASHAGADHNGGLHPLLVGVTIWWISASRYESTDDAFIDARTVTISSQLSARVVDVPVTDNQLVPAGTVLVSLDKSDYQAQLDQAKAQVDQAQANIANIDAQIAAQQARIDEADKQVVQAQAVLTFAQQQNERYGGLVKTGAVTVEQAQQYNSNFLQAQAELRGRTGQRRRHGKAASRAADSEATGAGAA